MSLYYEAHITIDPVFDRRRQQAEEIAKTHRFRLAKLIMRKSEADKEQVAKDDTFMTSNRASYIDLSVDLRNCVKELQMNDFVVRRYKIEDTLVDSRSPGGDIWRLL